MDNLTNPSPQPRHPSPWLVLVLVGGLLAIAAPGYSGSAPSGANSGVTTTGSSILPLGASNVGREPILESTTPNAIVDAATGELVLTAAAQQSLNQTAGEILRGLQASNPSLASTLSAPATLDLGAPIAVGTLGGIDGVTETEETIGEIAARAAAAIAAGNSFALTSDLGSLGIEPPPTAPPGGTSAVFIPGGGTPIVIPLNGTPEQIANAAGFLVAAFAAGIPPQQVNLFTNLALTGASYQLLVPLLNATGGLLPTQPQPTAVNATQLEAAIQAYNRILNNSDADTLTNLSQNADFVSLGRSLQQLRAAVDL